MKQRSDPDEKSKTSSAVDAPHYPERHEVASEDSLFVDADHNNIARRAHELWLRRGCPEGSAEQDWFEAAERLWAMTNSQDSRSRSKSGSVQH